MGAIKQGRHDKADAFCIELIGHFIAWGDFGLGGFWLGGILTGGISSGGILAQGDFVLGGFCPGGFCPGGFCPGGFCPGGFCPGGFCPVTPNFSGLQQHLLVNFYISLKGMCFSWELAGLHVTE